MANPEFLKKIQLIVSCSSLAALLILIVLILRKPPAPDVPYDPRAAAQVERKFAAAAEATNAGQPAQVQMDRTELNSYLKQNLQLAGPEGTLPSPETQNNSLALPAGTSPSTTPSTAAPNGLPADDQATLEQVQSSVKDVKVDMDGDLVKAYVIFDLHGKDMSLELDGHLGTRNGYITFDPVGGKLGLLPLPQSMLDAAVEKMMSSPENREKLRLPDDISDVQIANGQALVSYK